MSVIFIVKWNTRIYKPEMNAISIPVDEPTAATVTRTLSSPLPLSA